MGLTSSSQSLCPSGHLLLSLQLTPAHVLHMPTHIPALVSTVKLVSFSRITLISEVWQLVKGNGIPLQAWEGSWIFETLGTMKVVRSSS